MYSIVLSFLLFSSLLSIDSEQLTYPQARAVLMVAGWPPEHRHAALQVAACESSLMPNVTGDNRDSIGLFMIQWEPSTWRGWRHAPALAELHDKDIRNPYHNARAALLIFRDHGWEPWTCQPWGRR